MYVAERSMQRVFLDCVSVIATLHELPTGRGPVAQWLEPDAHNGLVGGSSPSGPTNKINGLQEVLFP